MKTVSKNTLGFHHTRNRVARSNIRISGMKRCIKACELRQFWRDVFERVTSGKVVGIMQGRQRCKIGNL